MNVTVGPQCFKDTCLRGDIHIEKDMDESDIPRFPIGDCSQVDKDQQPQSHQRAAVLTSNARRKKDLENGEKKRPASSSSKELNPNRQVKRKLVINSSKEVIEENSK